MGDAFEKALANFTLRLTQNERDEFRLTSFDDLQQTVESIQKKQGLKREMMNLTRIQRFLEAMHQYSQVASAWADCFDMLLDAYKQLSENIPLLKEYKSLFENNPQMSEALVAIFEDILNFHRTALRVFKQPTWRLIFRSAWKDFKTRFQHILDDLGRHKVLVESYASIIRYQEAQNIHSSIKNAIHEAQAVRVSTRTSFESIEKATQEKRLLDVNSWLSSADTIVDQEGWAAIRHDYPSTGRWILEDIKVKAWINPRDTVVPTLWIHGIPGAGKTILTSVIVEECNKLQSTPLAYFYCRYQDQQKRTFLGVARAFLTQLLNQNVDLLLPYLHDHCISSGQVSLISSQLCMELLNTALNTMPTVHIIIDGIDECEVAERKIIMSFFTSVVKGCDVPGKIRALFVSQNENDIRKILQNSTVLRLTDNDIKADIESYTSRWSIQIQQKFQLLTATKEYIVSLVCNGSDGMFLFAKLVLTNLFWQPSQEKLYEELQPNNFPSGFEQAYLRIVTRIFENPHKNAREATQKLLGWISCSKRPLKWHEIQGVVSINLEEGSVDFDNRKLCTNKEDIRELCGSLIDVLPGDTIQLVHASAKSFLTHNNYIKIHDEERKLAIICLQYLMLECFDIELADDRVIDYLSTGSYGFQDYAVLHWVDHIDALMKFQSASKEDNQILSATVDEFYEVFGTGDMSVGDISQDMRDVYHQSRGMEHYDTILLLLAHARKSRKAENDLNALGKFGKLIMRNRALLESLGGANNLAAEKKQKLKLYYGPNWYRCPRHACFYFHEGFLEASRLKDHVNRHKKPYLCTELSCPRIHFGFSTERELKKHMDTNHPDPQAFAWRFPKVKKPPTRYTCEECQKTFTRKHNLVNHRKAAHGNDRQYSCNFCPLAFVRKYDRDRHERKLHPLEKRDTELSLSTLVGSRQSSFTEHEEPGASEMGSISEDPASDGTKLP